MAATFNGKFGELSKRLIGIVIALLFQLPIFATFFSRTLLAAGHSHGNSRMAFRQRCLAALALTMESAHVLELRQKMQYGERSRNIYTDSCLRPNTSAWWGLPSRFDYCHGSPRFHGPQSE